ncbi:39S ribosomal protein L30, mitochondrial-like Protein [Tribolium castaneum]|uniref:Large ribosomal subunit protein uL30m n=1 Tax=Tribolium castaneum TaxID=7070 RepID=D6X4V9_TRICA|nr:PREDICTED: 39S ribosomal protein L30, mitochondrial [Tribolium castaneum]EEZ97592.1 39S ribosomal protein L30, mitochondrial-like Protein [Tribolium castaneum]|eukprot:XP_967800.1 PREDICTED: 39S ribosomal protein L30, mitochondrial [Tribolium castaneum]
MASFLKNINIFHNIQRFYTRTRRYNWAEEGVQYPGFKYYPRYPDFKDPPYEPSKVFRVQRIKALKGVPHYEKKILAEFHLTGKQSDVVIVKNIPENNQRLWKVKHLVQIKPVTFPDGFPSSPKGAVLKENGELRAMKTLEPSEERLQLAESFKTKAERMDGDTLRRDSRRKWLDAWDTTL